MPDHDLNTRRRQSEPHDLTMLDSIVFDALFRFVLAPGILRGLVFVSFFPLGPSRCLDNRDGVKHSCTGWLAICNGTPEAQPLRGSRPQLRPCGGSLFTTIAVAAA